MPASAQSGAATSEGSGTAAVPDPVSRASKNRRWRTFSLRGLMLLVVLAAVILARETNLARRQRNAIVAIERAGGTVAFDDVVGSDGNPAFRPPFGRPQWQRWVMRNLGDDYVRKVRVAEFSVFAPRDRRATKLGPEIRDALRNLPELTSLYLEQLNVTDEDFAVVGRLRKLHHIDLQGNRAITDAGLAHLENLTELTYLGLRNTAVSDDGVTRLMRGTHLTHLRAGHTRVGDGTLALVGQNPELLALDLSGTRVTDAGMPHLRAMKYLRELDLSETQINDEGIANIAGLTTLQILYLNDTPTGDAGMESLRGLTRLEHLSLGRNVTDKSLPILKNMKKLMTLHVTSSKITAEGAQELKQALPSTNIIR